MLFKINNVGVSSTKFMLGHREVRRTVLPTNFSLLFSANVNRLKPHGYYIYHVV
jgi:hypothetical protein